MTDVAIKFQNEGVEGIIPVGTVLGDAMRRFGVHFGGDCDTETGEHCCRVIIGEGADLLSSETDVEKEHLSQNGRKRGERLACEATLIKPGEITVMTVSNEKEEPAANTAEKDRLVDEFSELPLEKKLASLLRMEAVALGETFDYVISSPLKVIEKAGEVMAEFGMKLEEKAKAKSRPSTSTSKKTGSSSSSPRSRKGAGTGKKGSASK